MQVAAMRLGNISYEMKYGNADNIYYMKSLTHYFSARQCKYAQVHYRVVF